MICLAAAPLAALDHASWDASLKQHVNASSRVDYSAWKAAPESLDRYLSQLAAPWPGGLAPAAEKAALINAYNALTIRWILTHYPVESIWKTRKPFTEVRHTLNGKKLSLDQIEAALRRTDPRIHAALVCAARSCPPLRREAYVGSRIDGQLDDNTRAWLADSTLNRFDVPAGRARVSSIFKWYSADFASSGLQAFLEKYAPPDAAPLWRLPKLKIDYEPYHWGLNDRTSLGESYSGGVRLWYDYLRNK